MKGSHTMKNVLKAIAIVTLAAILCVSFTSCSLFNKALPTNQSTDIPITFDKKYIQETPKEEDNRTYTFYANQTGIMERYYVYNSEIFPEDNYVLSGTVEFEWRIADGCVYLFKTGERYNDDHTEKKNISLTDLPFSFGDEFMICVGGNGGVSRYILEGSELEALITE